MGRITKTLVAGIVALGVVAAPAAASDPKAEPMRLRDACNKVSFDATFGPGLCQRNAGSVTAQEFLSKLNPQDFGHGAWWINASGGRVGTTTIKAGDWLSVLNEGGENHTFTEVEKYTTAKAFTGGCIPPLSSSLGLQPFPGDCGKAIAETTVAPRGTSTRKNLALGTHHFVCVFHPWMRQTVKVEKR